MLKKNILTRNKILHGISITDIKNFNDKLSNKNYYNITEYKKHFLNYFNNHFKKYYEDFQNYFSDSDTDKEPTEEIKKKEVKKEEIKKKEVKIGLRREITDAFYTKSIVANMCINKLLNVIDIKKYDIIVEPSAGSGSFSDIFKTYNDLVILSYDINPKKKYIKKQDFLNLKTDFLKNKNVLTVGNPPFGRQSSLAKKFIKKCATFSNIIAFILPKSFKKESMCNQFPLQFHKIYEINLPDNSFIIDKIYYNVPCVFQVWKKENFERKKPIKYFPINYKFVKKTDNPDISLRRVGVYAGNISKDIKNKSSQSHYFIKINTIKVDDFIKEFEKIKFNTDNTVGPKSISKNEFIKEINKFMN